MDTHAGGPSLKGSGVRPSSVSSIAPHVGRQCGSAPWWSLQLLGMVVEPLRG